MYMYFSAFILIIQDGHSPSISFSIRSDGREHNVIVNATLQGRKGLNEIVNVYLTKNNITTKYENDEKSIQCKYRHSFFID